LPNRPDLLASNTIDRGDYRKADKVRLELGNLAKQEGIGNPFGILIKYADFVSGLFQDRPQKSNPQRIFPVHLLGVVRARDCKQYFHGTPFFADVILSGL
jgi:hypothetical protein